MKLTISTKDFAAAIGRLRPIAARKSTLPILGNVLLEAIAPDQLLCTANDLDQMLRIPVACQVQEPGSITLPCRQLHAALSRMEGETALGTADTKHLATLQSGTATLKMFGVAASEFPPSPETSEVIAELSLAGPQLAAWLSQVSSAQSDDAARPILSGICLQGAHGTLNIVATNGRFLHAVETEHKCPDLEVIVPSAAVALITDIAAALSAEDTLTLIITERVVMVKTPTDILFSARLIEGRFPNWRQVIPNHETAPHKVGVQRDQLISAINFAAVMSPESKDRAGSIKLTMARGRVTVQGFAPDQGETEISVDRLEGNSELAMAVDPRFLRASLTAYPAAIVSFSLQDNMSPFLFRAGPFTAVVMPMRVT